MTVLASDGLPARPGGPWTQEKLGYVKKYAEAFMIAMSKKWGRLVYIDPLAGPGRDINSETGEEFPGSPLIALSVRPKFHKLYLGDASSDHVKALRQTGRVGRGAKTPLWLVPLRIGEHCPSQSLRLRSAHASHEGS